MLGNQNKKLIDIQSLHIIQIIISLYCWNVERGHFQHITI